ncbi:MAG: cytochrome c [Proteobacteria bacterium]|nr:cytochrome c [Pseudomonadota bacterium]
MNNKAAAKVSFREKRTALLVLSVVAGGVLVFIYQSSDRAGSALVEVKVPGLSAIGQQGEAAFAKNCAQCHGENAAGGTGGPPLVHNIYNPGHHADGAFRLALQRGVPQHHWRFGNMPPQRHVGKDDANAIIAYVRELQAANGIVYQPHRMR